MVVEDCLSQSNGGGGLLEAAQDASLASSCCYRLLHHINSCETSQRNLPRSAVYCVYVAIYLDPSVLFVSRGVPLPRQRAEEKHGCFRQLLD